MTEKTFNKYKLVVDEYFINGFNGTKAYQKFYPNSSENTADVEFRELTEIDRIKNYLKEKVKQYARTYSFLKVGKITARVRELLKFNRAKIIALLKKAKALDKAIQRPSKHR